MQRYFIQFTYWGTRFRGLQKQRHRPLDLHKLPEDEISEVKLATMKKTCENIGSKYKGVQEGRGDGAGRPGVRPLAHTEACQQCQARHQLQVWDNFTPNDFKRFRGFY